MHRIETGELRVLARKYFEGELNYETYRNARTRLLDEITLGIKLDDTAVAKDIIPGESEKMYRGQGSTTSRFTGLQIMVWFMTGLALVIFVLIGLLLMG